MSNLIDRQAAVDWVQILLEQSEDDAHDKTWNNAIRAAINAVNHHVPSAQPEQTNCEYCHEDSDGYVKPVEKNCHAFIRFGMDGWELSLKTNGWHGSAKIRYCPMCGRRLIDE